MTVDTPRREALIAVIAPMLEGHSFGLRQGEHHEEVATRIVDEVLRRLAAKPTDEGVREATIDLCARVANRYRPNLMAKDIEQAIRAISRKQKI